jgi:endonuclease/exonuclease/phosphatase family metal-dependent hydrolase
MVYDHGHHGNAILSRFPILHEHNQDVTHLRFEKRGLLHCALEVPGLRQPLHCVCVHFRCSRARGAGRWRRWRAASRNWCRPMRRC